MTLVTAHEWMSDRPPGPHSWARALSRGRRKNRVRKHSNRRGAENAEIYGDFYNEKRVIPFSEIIKARRFFLGDFGELGGSKVQAFRRGWRAGSLAPKLLAFPIKGSSRCFGASVSKRYRLYRGGFG
jgi:hypothetical protein